MFSTNVIVAIAAALLVSTVIPGLWMYWPQHRDPVSRSDLGVALVTGAFIAFAILGLQLMIEVRSQHDARDRDRQANRESLLLVLSRSRDLAGLNLGGQDASHAYLSGKTLTGANLARANMDDASLERANLVGATFDGANLRNAHLQRSDLRQASFVGADLRKANLTGADLDTADLSSGPGGERPVDLRGAVLTNASVRANLRGADLRGAYLDGAKLAPANLAGADLTGATLRYADLRGANLRGANLVGALDMKDVKDVSYAVFDARTTWPPDFNWSKHKRTCTPAGCTIAPSTDPINDFPPGVAAIRTALGKATDSQDCLPGWWIEEQPYELDAHSPHGDAMFGVLTGAAAGLTPSMWSTAFGDHGVHPLRGITVPGFATYAHRFSVVGRRHRSAGVAVFFIKNGLGYRLWALAPPDVFPIFERDFQKLFHAAGVRGNLFPTLRQEKAKCPA